MRRPTAHPHIKLGVTVEQLKTRKNRLVRLEALAYLKYFHRNVKCGKKPPTETCNGTNNKASDVQYLSLQFSRVRYRSGYPWIQNAKNCDEY